MTTANAEGIRDALVVRPGSTQQVTQVPVLIVGAGPVGLVAAIRLRKEGVAVRVVDELPAELQALVPRSSASADSACSSLTRRRSCTRMARPRRHAPRSLHRRPAAGCLGASVGRSRGARGDHLARRCPAPGFAVPAFGARHRKSSGKLAWSRSSKHVARAGSARSARQVLGERRSPIRDRCGWCRFCGP